MGATAEIQRLERERKEKLESLKKFMDDSKKTENGATIYTFEAEEFEKRKKEVDDFIASTDTQIKAFRVEEDTERRLQELDEPGRKFNHNTRFDEKGEPVPPDKRVQPKSLGDLIVDEGLKVLTGKKGKEYVDDNGLKPQKEHIELKLDNYSVSAIDDHMSIKGALMDFLYKSMTTSAGYPVDYGDRRRMVLSAQRRPVVADLIPQDDVGPQNAIRYIEETTFTNNAAAVAEGAAKPGSDLRYTDRTVNITKIATWIKASDEQLEDVPQLRALIDNRLTLMLRLEEERELLLGNPSGANPNELLGFLNKVGIQSDPKLAGEPIPDAIYRMFLQIMVIGRAEATGVIMNPYDWGRVRMMKNALGDYIYGAPWVQGEDRFFGRPVVATDAMTLGTALSGDFAAFSHISRRKGITIDIANQNEDDFIKNMNTILIEERLALEIYRAAAFGITTSLNVA